MSAEIPGISTSVDFPGPFSSHDVIVKGWSVPLLTAHPDGESDIMLVCDRRLAATFTVEEAERFVPFLADCIAVALGYGAHPNEESEQPLPHLAHLSPRRVHLITGIQSESEDSHD